ncbi:MAG: cytidylate kinase family protein, partial [Agathobacter sp.]|nr:cytidylate kinase family protein [Agathobacter sp.]
MEKTIICIGREYGSGGHEIGELLAKRTGYAFYDKEKLFEIAK